MKIMECSKCGNQVFMLIDGGVVMRCCDEDMKELVAGSVDASVEKHVPAVTIEGNTMHVVVGESPHPMVPAHYIQWIAVEQGDAVQFARLQPDREPKASFTIKTGEAYTVYEHCNLHGLWKAEGQA